MSVLKFIGVIFACGVWGGVFFYVNSIKPCISKINTPSSGPSRKLTLARCLSLPDVWIIAVSAGSKDHILRNHVVLIVDLM